MRPLYKNILLYSAFFILFLTFSYFIVPFAADEVWNFGFSYNIYNGMIPYKDFNLIITPFYFIFNALFFKVFSPNAFVMYFISAIFATISLYFISRVNNKSFYFIYSLLLLLSTLFFYPSYNLFCLYLFILIFYLNYNNKYSFLIGLFTGIAFIVKQNIGIILLLPIFFKLFGDIKFFFKSVIGFIIPILLLLFYLLFNGIFNDFINYCFLGLFDFSKNNGEFGVLFVFEVLIVLYIIYKIINDRGNFSSYLYLLCFQIITFPIFDINHFVIANVPNVIFFTRNININKFCKYIFIFLGIFIPILLINYFCVNDLKFFKYRRVRSNEILLAKRLGKYIIDNSDNMDVHIISNFSYFVKLENGLKIDEYDLLLYSNLGYNSYSRMVNKINNGNRDK